MNKGQTILQVVMWATGVSMGVASLAYNVVAGQLNDLEKVNREQDIKITISEVRLERVPVIEAKLDAILKLNGITPSSIKAQNETN